MDKDKKLSLHSILNNSKALVIISIAMAFVIWISISLNEAPEVERVIKDVKVTIDDSVPNQLGYEAFGADNLYVDITVKGKRYLVGDNVLKADDITVTAITTYVDSPGSYTLQLKATSKNSNAKYTITAKSQDYVEVYFDAPKSTEVAVEPNVICANDLLYSDDYITEDPVVSTEKITVTGPATEISKIQKAIATVKTDGKLRKTETYDATLEITDSYGVELKYLTVADTAKSLTVTIPVYKIAELPVTADFTNTPLYYIENPLTVVCSPTKIKAAVDETKLASLESISLGTIDFSKILPGLNTIEMDTSNIKDAVPMNKDQKFYVYVNSGDVAEIPYTITSDYINTVSNKSKYKLTVKTESLDVKLVGPSSALSALAAGDVYAEIDSSKITEGNNSIPATIKIKNNQCWAYGTYMVDVTAE